jgi:hypothetical protein
MSDHGAHVLTKWTLMAHLHNNGNSTEQFTHATPTQMDVQ